MSELIESYLSKLESRLSRKLVKSEVSDHIQEVRAHLHESVENLRSDANATPEVTALKRIGPDKLLAENLVRAQKGVDTKSSWRFIVLPSIALLALGVTAEVISLTDTFPVSIWVLLTWLPTIFIILVALAVIRSRRLLIGPLAVAFTIFVIGLTTVESIWGPFGVSSHSVERRKEEVAGFEKYISHLESQVSAGKQVLAGGTFGPLLKQGNALLAPKPLQRVTVVHEPLNLSSTKQTYPMAMLVSVQGEAEARSLWKKHSEAYFTWVNRQLAEQHFHLRTWKSEAFMPSPLTIAKNLLITGLYSMTVVVIVCFVSLGFVRVRQRLIGLAWRPERIRA